MSLINSYNNLNNIYHKRNDLDKLQIQSEWEKNFVDIRSIINVIQKYEIKLISQIKKYNWDKEQILNNYVKLDGLLIEENICYYCI